MMPAELELSRSPAFQITYRFLITGPVAGALSAAVMLLAGPDLLNAVRSTYMIGALHIILIGFINLTMMGALHQFIPVLSGRPIPGSRWVFQTIYLLSVIGLFLFVTGMFRQNRIAILAGATCILCGHVLFLISSLYTLAGIARTDAT